MEEEKEISTEDLMKKIRNEVKDKIESGEYSSVPPKFPEVLPYSMVRNVKNDVTKALNALDNMAELPLEGAPIHSHRKFLGTFIVSIKKISRYWTRKYTDALFAQQSNFNSHVTQTLISMKERIEHLEQRQKELEKKLEDNKSSTE